MKKSKKSDRRLPPVTTEKVRDLVPVADGKLGDVAGGATIHTTDPSYM